MGNLGFRWRWWGPLLTGGLLALPLPWVLGRIGFGDAALVLQWPGLLLLLRATGGFYAGVEPLGEVVLFLLNASAWAVLTLACVCVARRVCRARNAEGTN